MSSAELGVDLVGPAGERAADEFVSSYRAGRAVARPGPGPTEDRRPAAPMLRDAIETPSAPLAPNVTAEAAHRTGVDFSRVRVHSGPSVTPAADALHAQAFSYGSHVFVPGDVAAHRSMTPLLLHELGHVANGAAPGHVGRVGRQAKPDAPAATAPATAATADAMTPRQRQEHVVREILGRMTPSVIGAVKGHGLSDVVILVKDAAPAAAVQKPGAPSQPAVVATAPTVVATGPPPAVNAAAPVATTTTPAPQVGTSRGELREPAMLEHHPGAKLLPPKSAAVDAIAGGTAEVSIEVAKKGTQKILIVNVYVRGGNWISMKSLTVPTEANIKANIDEALRKVDAHITQNVRVDQLEREGEKKIYDPRSKPPRTPEPIEGGDVHGRVHLEGVPDHVTVHIELPTLEGQEGLVKYANEQAKEIAKALEMKVPVSVKVTAPQAARAAPAAAPLAPATQAATGVAKGAVKADVKVADRAVEVATRKEFLHEFVRGIAAGKSALKLAMRAESLIPIIGWAPSIGDMHEGGRDIAHGQIVLGGMTILVAIIDIGSDALHVGDLATGAGGTALSLTVQGWTTAMQLSMQQARTEGRLRELDKYIEDHGQLPPDLESYFGLNDEEIMIIANEISGFRPTKPAKQPTPAELEAAEAERKRKALEQHRREQATPTPQPSQPAWNPLPTPGPAPPPGVSSLGPLFAPRTQSMSERGMHYVDVLEAERDELIGKAKAITAKSSSSSTPDQELKAFRAQRDAWKAKVDDAMKESKKPGYGEEVRSRLRNLCLWLADVPGRQALLD